MSEGERAKGGARPSGGARAAPAGRATGSESASVKGDVRGAADVIEAEIESEDRLASGRPEDALVAALNLTKRFPIHKGIIFRKQVAAVHALEDITFTIRPGETLGLVGESGCGKSTTARVLLKLIEPTSGRVFFDGRDITGLAPREMRPLRREMQIIFQDPYASLNPRKTVGQIIGMPYRIHKTEGESKRKVQDLMDRVGLNPEHYNRYAHEFSGGQRQRIGVARALALRPKLIVCDEPVSALDVSIQAQILNLLEDLQQEFNLTYLFISHDLSVVRHIADRIAVMYLGHLVEVADATKLYETPRHPYTAALLSAVPKGRESTTVTERAVLTGDVPSPIDPPSGCPFHPRCPKARQVAGGDGNVPEDCRNDLPPLGEVAGAHYAACWYPVEEGEELHEAAHT